MHALNLLCMCIPTRVNRLTACRVFIVQSVAACLSVCQSVCLPVCLTVSSWTTCRSSSLSVCLHDHPSVRLSFHFSHLLPHLSPSAFVYLHHCVSAYQCKRRDVQTLKVRPHSTCSELVFIDLHLSLNRHKQGRYYADIKTASDFK